MYRAVHTETGMPAALKTVYLTSPRQLSCIRREIRVLANLSHPGIVRIFEEGIKEGKPWYAMELLEGLTLDKFCSEIIWSDRVLSSNWEDASEGQIIRRPASQTDTKHCPEILKSTIDAKPGDIASDTASSTSTPGLPRTRTEQHPPAAGGKLDDFLKLFHRICLTLAYLHGQGIVHLDLKPSNILVKPDGSPVIMDFGLMKEFWGKISRDELTTLSSTGGTLFFIPPEQLSGETVDARADLYSLGCMMYQFVTGQVPFRVRSIQEAREAHLKLIPISPSNLVRNIPSELDRLIIKLLEKKPQDRIGHADVVASILAKLGAGNGYSETLPKPRAYMYRPRFFGRRDTMDQIADFFGIISPDNGKFVLIGGDSGVGKTRLLHEIWRLAHIRKLQVFTGECLPQIMTEEKGERRSQTPFALLRKSIQDVSVICMSAGKALTDQIFGSRGKVLLPFFPELAELPGQARYPEPAGLLPDAARLRLFNSITQTLAEIVRIRPVVLLLDDLHWIDELSYNFFIFLMRTGSLKKLPILIIGTYRKEEIGSATARLIRTPLVIQMELEPLDRKDVHAMVADMLAKSTLSDKFGSMLNNLSEGNPFFISEYLRSCISDHLIYRDKEGNWQIGRESDDTVTDAELERLPVPGSVLKLVERRLDLLSDNARNIAGHISVIGRECEVMLLWNIIPCEEDVLDAMDELIRCRILKEIIPGTLQFQNDIFQKQIYKRIDKATRKDLHRKIAESLVVVFPDKLAENNAILGQHWENAEEYDKARHSYLAAARNAVSKYTPEDAEKCYRSYLRLTPVSEDSIRIRNEFSLKVLRFQPHPSAPFEEHRRAYRESQTLGKPRLEADSIIGLTQYQVLKGNLKRARVLLDKALTIYKAHEDRPGTINALIRLGFVSMREGDLNNAKTLYERALVICRDLSDLNFESAILSNLGFVLLKERKLDASMDCFEKNLKIHQRTGERHLEARALKNLGIVNLAKGAHQEAENNCKMALEILNEIGDRNQEGQIAFLLAGIHKAAGNLTEAISLFRKALLIQQEQGDRIVEGMIYSSFADVLFWNGEVDQAKDYYFRSIGIFEELNIEHYALAALLGLAALERLAFANYDETESLLKKVRKITEKSGVPATLCQYYCQTGHLDMARNQSAGQRLDRTLKIMAEHNLHNDHELNQNLKKLRSAVKTFEAGEILFRGEQVSHIHEGLRKWLIKNGTNSENMVL